MNANHTRLPLHKPYWGFREMLAASRVILRGEGGGAGAVGQRVEEELKKRLDSQFVLLCTSGTSALEMALWSLQLKQPCEVIVPGFTFVSTVTAVLRQGGIPVFADIAPETYNLDPELIPPLLNERTRAIIPVHYAGVGCPMERIMQIARNGGLSVVEDAAHGMGASYRGKPLGTFGAAGCFSFHITKNLTCGEGGAVSTADSTLASRMEMLREKGTNRAQFFRGERTRYEWVSEGSSLVLSDILAAIIGEQLRRIDAITGRRRQLALYLHQRLTRFAGDLILPRLDRMTGSNWHIFAVRFLNRERRDTAMKYLNKQGIGAAFHYLPLHLSPFSQGHPVLNRYRRGSLPVTEAVADTLLRLPLYPSLTFRQMDLIARHMETALHR